MPIVVPTIYYSVSHCDFNSRRSRQRAILTIHAIESDIWSGSIFSALHCTILCRLNGDSWQLFGASVSLLKLLFLFVGGVSNSIAKQEKKDSTYYWIRLAWMARVVPKKIYGDPIE